MTILFWSKVLMRVTFESQQIVFTWWEALRTRWYKLNMNGGVDMRSGSAIAGGIVRSYQGDWVVGYGRNIGVSSILEAELRAIVDGLETAWEKGVRQLLIESDSRTAVDQILGAKMVGLPRLASEVHNWISRDWQVDWRFDMYHEHQIWLLMLYTRQ
ncbi:hypothetical protein Goari_027238 [Gossypium aridum]|uniref:RNase H type-1 domain-containing protein n=1 Tax=Gossypium aridum TaxID=34290 RepID=A0A7J8YSD9_GOSAI|nr:hypothetical protein [Gossypium aridum]